VALSYVDTSFVMKLYVPEKESDEAIELARTLVGEAVINSLTDVEVAAALHVRLGPVEGPEAYLRYRRNRETGMFLPVEIDAKTFVMARGLAERYAAQFSLRALDALHLATAVQYGLNVILTYDKRLRDVSAFLGLTVLPARS